MPAWNRFSFRRILEMLPFYKDGTAPGFCPLCKERPYMVHHRCGVCLFRRTCDEFNGETAGAILRLPELDRKEVMEFIAINREFRDCDPVSAVNELLQKAGCQADRSDLVQMNAELNHLKIITWNDACHDFAKYRANWQAVECVDGELLQVLDSTFSYCASAALEKHKHQEQWIMISVVSYPELHEYHLTRRFTVAPFPDVSHTKIEITGGYYSFLRGDKKSSSRFASIFSPLAYRFDTVLSNGRLFFCQTECEDLLVGDARQIAHWIGPERPLQVFIRDLRFDPWILMHCGSLAGDLEIASLFWRDKTLIRDFSEE